MEPVKKLKRLTIELDSREHAEIKQRAAYRCATIREYVYEAIMDRINKEREYDQSTG